jgi:hypothetical protein
LALLDRGCKMLWSGHRTESMLRRYHIVDLDDLRRAGKKASDYRGPRENVIKGDLGRTAPGPRKLKAVVGAVVELSEC